MTGATYVAETIEEVRRPHIDWWTEAPQHRTYYLVTTRQGVVAELVRDEVAGTWGVARRLDRCRVRIVSGLFTARLTAPNSYSSIIPQKSLSDPNTRRLAVLV